MDATRIADDSETYVLLTRLVAKEAPYQREINELFSNSPLSSERRNHCVQLLHVIDLPNDPPIMVHPLLRPFDDPPLQTYGEFVSFFSQICEVGSPCSGVHESNGLYFTRGYNSCMRTMLLIGISCRTFWFVFSKFDLDQRLNAGQHHA
jgi:hypothetical protein